jgi:pyruvate,water dikinase
MLSRLLAEGFPVPDGIVVTTDAFTAHITQESAGTTVNHEEIVNRPLPSPVADALSRALLTFGDEPLAVRSSGVAEDLAEASFAGQYETVLGVRGYAAAVDAVRTCWSAGFRPQVRAYRVARGVAADRIAVLIQPLIAADAAGVAFTANPVTGDRSEAIVSAVRGLGDRLVSGTASPDEWLVRDGNITPRRLAEHALTEQEVRAVAELARRVEAYLGAPQDIEWALGGGKLYLLQARPITALPVADTPTGGISISAEAPPGFWERADSHYPQPLYPLTRSVLLAAANDGFRRMCGEFGLLWETVEEREIGGWVYLRGVPLGGKDRQPVPDWLMRILIRILPPLRDRLRRCVGAAGNDKAGKWVEQWHTELRIELVKRLAALRETDLRGLSDDALGRHAGAVRTLIGEGQGIHMMLNTALNLLLADFVFCCRDLLGWEEERVLEMLVGLSATSSAPARALSRLAQRVRENPVLAGLSEQVDRQTVQRMAAADADFRREFAEYEREFGCRAIRYEVADPALAEMPELVICLVRAQVRRGYDPDTDVAALAARRAHLLEAARRELARSPADYRERFDGALARAERAYPLREEHGFYDTSMPLALLRYAALEIGRRLFERRQIHDPCDVFLMEFDEALAALADHAPKHERTERRRRDCEWALAHPGPAHYGVPPGQPPSFAALPAPARFVHEAVLWFSQRVFAGAASDHRASTAGRLSGTPASGGKYTGPVRVVRNESEFSKIQAGDVLVCPITSPVWPVLFPSVGALVTDVGGFLSHSAIIAREYRIPAVVATGSATELLSDGDIVTVDGMAGSVWVERPS